MISFQYIDELRRQEMAWLLPFFRAGSSVLEVGGGTGAQAKLLSEAGFRVVSVDLPDSYYARHRVHPVLPYDGRRFPFGDAAFDVVFSSNVMEHVVDLDQMDREIRRVLKPGGYCLHVMPSASWRCWTLGTELLFRWPAAVGVFRKSLGSIWEFPRRGGPGWVWAALRVPLVIWRVLGRLLLALRYASIPPRHGERGNALTEIRLFSRGAWRGVFAREGWRVVEARPMGLFYTGSAVLGLGLSFTARRRLGRVLGSSCILYKLVPLEGKRAVV